MNTLDKLYRPCTEVRGYTVEGVEVKKVYKRNYRLNVADKKGRCLGMVGDVFVRHLTVAPDGGEMYNGGWGYLVDDQGKYMMYHPTGEIYL